MYLIGDIVNSQDTTMKFFGGVKMKTINNEQLNCLLDKYDTDILIKWNDTPTMKKLIQLLYLKKYNFICGFYINLTESCFYIKKQVYDYFYKFYHGNSNIYLHIFYNNITCKNEIQFTNLTNFKSYPQYKNTDYYVYLGM